MSQQSSPSTDLVLADPSHPNDTHPMISLAPNTQPFTLLKNPGSNDYQWNFNNRTSNNARVFYIGFTTSENNPLVTQTVQVVAGTGSTIVVPAASLNSSTNLWLGAWWDNGTYGTDREGIRGYFRDHPNASGHHTVPVIVG